MEREFDRNNFACVVNTHWHWDHFNGNQAFSDIKIYGHKNIIPAMREFEQGLSSFVKQRRDRTTAWKETLKNAKPGSEQALTALGWIYAHTRFIDEFKKRFTVTYPNELFEDKKIIDMGDLHLHLIHLPAFHSDNDVLVYIPEEKLLLSGDTFYSEYFPQIKHSAVQYIPKWINILEELLNGPDRVEKIIPGHKSQMSGQELYKLYKYIKDLKEGVPDSKKRGFTLEQTKEAYSIESKFNYLSSFPFYSTCKNQHEKNIQNIWLADKLSSIEVMKQLAGNKDISSAVEDFKQNYLNYHQYYLDESEFINFGYKLIMFGKNRDAIEIITLVTEKYPESWNAFDSLGEAYESMGEKEQSIKCYQKSISLNPDNKNAEEMLQKLK